MAVQHINILWHGNTADVPYWVTLPYFIQLQSLMHLFLKDVLQSNKITATATTNFETATFINIYILHMRITVHTS